jgi:hypothetical protein
MAENPPLHLEEVNLKYEGEVLRNTPTAHESLESGWSYLHPRQGGLGGVTSYPDADHPWDGGTQEGPEG